QTGLENAKSPLLGGFLSLIVPGAGEFYAESYLKSIIFIAIEAAAISTSVIYEGKGDDQTASFENFAHEHWNAGRYARWTITNLEIINPSLNPDDYTGLFIDVERTQVDWTVLNQLENDIGGYYSHRLAPFGDQQYFEMIGKYPQFNPGWDDFGDENTPFQFGDEVTENFSFYSGERGKANDYYNIASKAVIVTVINHVISAIDAAWTTSRYNKNLKMKMELEKTNIGYSTEYYPSLHIQYRF
ncbi:hypothetical protein ACFLTH_14655, partial [Bacteroidota bacterium]